MKLEKEPDIGNAVLVGRIKDPVKTTIFWAGLCEGSEVDVSRRLRETDQDKNLSKRLIQSIPKRFLALIYTERKQTPKCTILIMNEFLAIFCKILFSVKFFACTPFTQPSLSIFSV